LAEIQRLQVELDRANDSVDDKLDKLEDAGQGVVGLTRKLTDARSRITALEEELARLNRKDERRQKRLEKARCLKCRSKVALRDHGETDERYVFGVIAQHLNLVADSSTIS
jgi:predicted  nucleic acid-binding Zn-ribbon protein